MVERLSPLPSNAIGALFILALVIPVVLTVVAIERDALSVAQASCETLSEELETLDASMSITTDPVLLLGNQRIRRWHSPPEYIQDRPVLTRASSQLSPNLIAECFTRVIGYYRPQITLLFLEPADVYEHADTTLANLVEINRKRDYFDVSPNLAVILPLPTPRHSQKRQALIEFRTKANQWASKHPNTVVIDGASMFEASTGQPDARLFWPDGQTLTSEGYTLLDSLVTASIEPYLY